MVGSGTGWATPIGGLAGRVYYDYSLKGVAQTSLATFVGYAADKFSIGAEYNTMKNVGFGEGKDWDGLSFYSTIQASDKVKFFARYDKLYS